MKLPTNLKLREVPISSIAVWEEAEARELNKEGIKELAASIEAEGLQNPPVVQKEGGMYKLISGQRRLEALRRLGVRNVPVLVVEDSLELADAKAASVIENVHRKQMNAGELSQACHFLVEKMGSKREAAAVLGLDRRTFARYYGFRGVPDQLKGMVPKKISRDDATRLWELVPEVGRSVEIAEKISRYTEAGRKRYLKALEEDPSAQHDEVKRRAERLGIAGNVFVGLTAEQARGLARLATEDGMEPSELAKKVLADWLARRGYN